MATGLDPNIPFQALQGQYNPAETMQNQFRLKALLQEQQFQNEERGYQRDERQRAASLRDALSGAYNQETGRIDPDRARAAYVGAGDIQGAMTFDKSQRESEKARIEQGLSQVSAVAQLAGSAVDQNSYVQALQQAQAMGLDISRLPPQFDPQVVNGIRMQALDAKGQLEQAWKSKEFDLDERKFGYQQQNDTAQRQVQMRGQDITVRGQNLTNARAQEANVIGALGVGKEGRKAEGDLRKEFNALPIAKDFSDMRASMGKIRSLASRGDKATASDDIAMIFSFMKMLDPGSVVREGEFANAQNAAGIPDRVVNAYNNALAGNKLNTSQRRQFAASAANVYLSAREQYNAKANEYRGIAKDYGANPDRVASRYKPTNKAPSASNVVDFNSLPE